MLLPTASEEDQTSVLGRISCMLPRRIYCFIFFVSKFSMSLVFANESLVFVHSTGIYKRHCCHSTTSMILYISLYVFILFTCASDNLNIQRRTLECDALKIFFPED